METRWYRSLYWRIGLGFILFLAATLAAHMVVGAWIVSRAAATLPGRAPGNFAALVASDLSEALTTNPSLDLDRYVKDEYAHVSYPMVVVMRDGRVVNPSAFPNPEGLVRFGRMQLERAARAERLERERAERGEAGPADGGGRGRFGAGGPGPGGPGPNGQGPRMMRRRGMFGAGPVSEPARIVVHDQVVGVVVVPPRAPMLALMRELAPSLGAAAIVLVALVTVIAALVIFKPARRRLQALEQATARLGAGDLSARAPVAGGDEIASLAQSFNTMADELSARAARIEEEDRRRRQLLADVSHELATPLTAIRGYIETLTMPELSLDGATRQRYLGVVGDETMRLERIVADLLDLARLEGGGSSVVVRDVPVSRLFDRVVARHERTAAEKQVRITAAIAPGAEQVHVDPDRMEQALQNLAANALRHTPVGGTVQLDAAKAGSSIVLSVTDSGDGIAPEHLPHVFDRFYKADQSRASATSSGSGLGLSIVKAIAERHGGSVTVDSTPGQTVFRIVLPAAA